jgi:tRNA(adenine34) deaminase
MVPEFEHNDGAAVSRQAQAFWQHEWQGKSFMALGAQDPVLGAEVMQALRKSIRHCPEAMALPQAGHFVQEHGKLVAQAALKALGSDTL